MPRRIITDVKDWPDYIRYFHPLSDQGIPCSHSKEVKVDLAFLYHLEAFRKSQEYPFIITCWYRSPEHPLEINRTRLGKVGAHTGGWACDLTIPVGDRSKKALRDLYEDAITFGFLGVGDGSQYINPKGHISPYIHVDDDQSRLDNDALPSQWGYYPSWKRFDPSAST